MVSYLCDIANVSRSGYYKYFSKESISTRENFNANDEIAKDNILLAFNFKGHKRVLNKSKWY